MTEPSPPTPEPFVGDAAKAVLLRARSIAQSRGDVGSHSLDVLEALAEAREVRDLLARFEATPEQIDMRIGARNWIGPVSEEAVEERTVEAGRSIARELGDREVVPVHLLVAVASHGGWSAADVLVSVGITGDDLIGSIRFARGELDDWVPGVRPTEPTDEAFAEIKRWEELQETFGSPLRRVIGVGAARTAEGVAVELLALEIREQVMLVHWRAVTASDALLTMPDIAVTDSSGTRYDVFGGEGGGGRHEFRGHFFVMPPPPDSGTLTIEVVSFGRRDWAAYLPDEAEHRGVSGPWRFEIDLAS